MSEDTILLEVMLELAEDENTDLKLENEALWKYNSYLEQKNKELYNEYYNLLDTNKRLN